MNIYVLRHGFVTSSGDTQDSSKQIFTNLGLQILADGEYVALVGTSPERRAFQSAEALAAAAVVNVTVLNWLKEIPFGGDDFAGRDEVKELLHTYSAGSIVLVSHWPRIRTLMMFLMAELTGDPDGPWIAQDIDCCDGWCILSSGEATPIVRGRFLDPV